MEKLFSEQVFEKTDYKENFLAKGEYESCVFRQCDFYQSDCSEIIFIDCVFETCNLGMIQVHNTVFRDVKFTGCKMLGIHFEQCNKFGLAFRTENCVLDHSSFYQTSVKKSGFIQTSFTEVDFTDCNLTECVFDGCDLRDAKFENTILQKADLRTSYNYSIDPEQNKIKKARFSLAGIPGLLDKYDIIVE